MRKQEHAEILKKVIELSPTMYADGMSICKIANTLGCSFTKVRTNLVRLGIVMRPFSTKGLQPRLGAKLTDETKEKISLAHKGKILSPEHREKVIKTLVYGQKGQENKNWKGGMTRKEGYVFIRKPEHPRAYYGDYVRRADLVAEKKIGRSLMPGEIVDHVNNIRDDDRPENLRVCDSARDHNFITYHQRKSRGEFDPLFRTLWRKKEK